VLVRATVCSKCGNDREEIEAHHEDYEKPLEITWLCVKCHAKIRKEKRGEAKKRLVIYLDGETIARLDRLAALDCRNRASYLTWAILSLYKEKYGDETEYKELG
ncbi:MAG TPA: hypothetical protein VNZ45_13840, partial [Bacteroidia bacterium]|nr:hypothetical protein [Bacteroidia bacterium]